MLFCSAAAFGAAAVLPQTWWWWSARSYVAVEATVLAAQLNEVRVSSRGSSGGRSSGGRVPGDVAYRVSAEYSYQFRGHTYRASETGSSGSDSTGSFQHQIYRRLTGAREAGSTVTAWVDPEQPARATLHREFRWGAALLPFFISAIFTALGLAALTLPFGALRRPAKGTLVAADHGPYLFAALFGGWWTVLASALAVVAVAEMVHGLRLPHVAALCLLCAGMALVAVAWRQYEQRWLRGLPLLERLDHGAGRFTLRLHFRPALGLRMGPRPGLRPGQPHAPHRIGVVVRQMEYNKHANKTTVAALWRNDLGEHDVAHGSLAFDSDPDAPAWRAAQRQAWPAHWEVTLRILGSTVVYRLAP